MQWVQSVQIFSAKCKYFQQMQIFSWLSLKSNIYIPTLKINQYSSYDISMTYSWYGQELFRKVKLQTWSNQVRTQYFTHQYIIFGHINIKRQGNTLQTILYRKPTDQQSYLHAHSDHLKSLKISIPYSQALRIKTICSTLTEYKNTVLYWNKNS